MKSISWWMCLMTAVASLALFGRTTPVFAAAEDRRVNGEQFQRLERRMDELAQRQEQLMRQLGALQEHLGPMPVRGPESVRPPMPALGLVAAKAVHRLGGVLRIVLLVAALCNILLAVWIYRDIRKRGEGSGIFVALALVAGIPTAILYALVRIGDKKP